MFSAARSKLSAILTSNPWVSELAAILPLSALIDFIPGPDKLHVLQLTGHGPLWSWIVTPSMSRLLLGPPEPGPVCFLDGYGKGPSMKCIDGKFGDNYYAASPQTIRWCLEARQPIYLRNGHGNLSRTQGTGKSLHLDVVHVTRPPEVASSEFRARTLVDAGWQDLQASILSCAGWLILLGGIVCSILLGLYLAVAFLVIAPLTGVAISQLHRGGRRTLDVSDGDYPATMVLGTSTHMHDASWTMFYGQLSLINSLLLRPLKWEHEPDSDYNDSRLWRFILRLLIAGQWACAIAAATTKDFDSYMITFWIVFCIVSHSYIYPPPKAAGSWLETTSQCKIQRYSTTISSRRTLYNVVIAFNHENAFGPGADGLGKLQMRQEGFKCIKPIMMEGYDRRKWETATLEATNIIRSEGQVSRTDPSRPTRFVDIGATGFPADKKEALADWKRTQEPEVGARFILEGMEVAGMIKQQMREGTVEA